MLPKVEIYQQEKANLVPCALLLMIQHVLVKHAELVQSLAIHV